MASLHLCLNNTCKTTACRIAPAPFAAVRTSVHLSRCCAVQGAENPRQVSSSSAAQQLSTTPKKAIFRPLSQANRNLSKSKAVPVVPYIGTKTALQAQYSTSVPQPPPTEPIIHSVFEPGTSTWQYIVADPATNAAAIIDPVLDYDPVSLSITTTSADALLDLVHAKGYTIQWILETHAHADHLTSASYLQHKLAEEQGATEADWEGEAGLGKPCIGIGKRIGQVQTLFGRRYGVPPKEYEMVFDKLFEDDETFKIGEMDAMAIHLPGHTPDHLGYKIGDNVFCGDTIFPVDVGTARCDFPGGSTQHMWASTQRLLSFSPETRIYSGHDYPPGDARKEPVAFMTVAEHKVKNKHLREGTTEADFLAMRKERDDVLGAPRLLHQSVQVNIRAGKLPEPNEAGHRLLHTPLKLKGVDAW